MLGLVFAIKTAVVKAMEAEGLPAREAATTCV
jgi:hypothetical protein